MKMWNKRIFKIFLISVVLLWMGYFSIMPACAFEAAPDVSIQLSEGARIDNSEIDASVQVKFNDMSFYNDQVYLSYHIFDDIGETVINENERIKIDLDSQERQQFELAIDLTEAKTLAGDDRLVVVFDIIDEKNVYWFSADDSLNFDSISIATHRTVGQKLLAEMGDSKVIFGINAIVFVVSVIAAVSLYKKLKV